ncbi:PTS fructose transporter subunit IIC [Clostridium folliculivorans]|uniref:PTS fructose transporter subunit IIBC n=1 Tax=Clostridium folliculivorans TaxID=2886038 RepID=A0A9W6DDM7_9CLOT|nr:fructose-specific PTS transporter subunit EIIC [Clostridium folliculivorans]GKU27857.1 PTS fructose transporter subunit IIBC [Clostridium folliculivorans]GKU32604.1 PTS fructose transporter subunit IIBC [Clostridium folliculivorans]
MKLVAITSCPTGIAHTYMAAEALQMAAKELGHEIKVETQGSVGAENVITQEDLRSASAVIIAADTNVDKSRFAGMPLIEVSVKDAIKDPKALIQRALTAKASDAPKKTETSSNSQEKENRNGPYKHLMNGVSFMIPFVVAGGILIALSFAFGIKAFEVKGSLAEALFRIGANGAFSFLVPILAGYIAYSIADRPGLVPGMVGGYLASNIGSGFLGGLIAGFLAGYTVYYLKKVIKLPKSLEGLMPVLVLPVLSTLIVGLIMIYVLGNPVKAINDGLTGWLNSLSGTNAILLGTIIGLMMAFDMGGPLNKAAYTFGVATISQGQPSAIMAAVMAAGMVPPLAVAVATVLGKNKFTTQEREAGKAAWALGAAFITEGAIPFAAADPLRVIPSIMVGSALTGALSMLFKCTLAVPHGGLFVFFIPNAVGNVLMYVLSILIGAVVGGVILSTVKKPVA